MNADPASSDALARLMSPRACSPAETLRKVLPHLGTLGITRIANITGLDFIGLPVVNVIRPNARFLVAAQGKGLDLDAAKASGVMEATEVFAAETVASPTEPRSAEEMARHHRLPALDKLPRQSGSRFHTGTPILWSEGEDLIDGGCVSLPFELVHMNFVVPGEIGAGNFLLSGNGLASGNTAHEATSHALHELIERDASALFSAEPALQDERRVDLEAIHDPICARLIERLSSKALAVGIWDMTSDIGVPAFRCEIMERPSHGTPLPQPASGEGCDLDPYVALCRAITEAAQARLSMIAGVRDDLGAELYGAVDDPLVLLNWWSHLAGNPGRRRIEETRRCGSRRAEDDVTLLLERLTAAGLDHPIAVDLTPAFLEGVSVTRVVVPGLEPPPETRCRPGSRLRAKLDAAA